MANPILEDNVRIKVRFSEVDALRVVWHGNYVQYLEDAREAFGHKYGLSYRSMAENGYFAPIVDVHMEYKHPATVDEELNVNIAYVPVTGGKIVFDYEITNISDGLIVLKASTIQLFTTIDGLFEPSCPDFYADWKQRMQQD